MMEKDNRTVEASAKRIRKPENQTPFPSRSQLKSSEKKKKKTRGNEKKYKIK